MQSRCVYCFFNSCGRWMGPLITTVTECIIAQDELHDYRKDKNDVGDKNEQEERESFDSRAILETYGDRRLVLYSCHF